MFIHIVEPGDTVFGISQQYNICPSRLLIQNGITNPNRLVINDALIILQPKEIYIVQEGDTLDRIAAIYNIDIMQLLRNNPNVSQRNYLIVGEEIVISYIEEDEKPLISINGYVYPYVSTSELRASLPFLTYLTVMHYRILSDGTIIALDNDDNIIQLAKSYGVAPIMLVTVLDSNMELDLNVFHEILNSQELMSTLIEDLLRMVRKKGYYGINIDLLYIYPTDRSAFLEFGQRLLSMFNEENFYVFITISPSTFEVSSGIEYDVMNYQGLNQVANSVVYLLTYDWYNPHDLPKSALPYETVVQSIQSTLLEVSEDFFNLGYTSVGFLYTLPFSNYDRMRFINTTNAVELAYDVGASISYNEITKNPYYIYIANGNEENLVWYKDPRTFQSIIDILKEDSIQEVSIWNVMSFYPRQSLMYSANFEIKKVELDN